MKSYYFLFCFFLLAACRQKPASPYELALLSAHVYDSSEINNLPEDFASFLSFDEDDFRSTISFDHKRIKEMKEKEEWGKLIFHVAGKFISNGGYFGRAYLNERTGHIIIAHRGTDLEVALEELSVDDISLSLNEGNLWNLIKDIDDDYEIFQGNIPKQQFEAAQHFTKVVKEKYVQQYSEEPIIIHTGHSLGAVLAELCAVKDKTKAITFESPGIQPMVEQLDLENFNPDKVDITAFNAAPNQINSLHQHLGTVVPLYDTSQVLSAYSTEELSALRKHSIRELLKYFDPETGAVLGIRH